MRTINLYTFNISILRRLYDIYKYYLHTVIFITTFTYQLIRPKLVSFESFNSTFIWLQKFDTATLKSIQADENVSVINNSIWFLQPLYLLRDSLHNANVEQLTNHQQRPWIRIIMRSR